MRAVRVSTKGLGLLLLLKSEVLFINQSTVMLHAWLHTVESGDSILDYSTVVSTE